MTTLPHTLLSVQEIEDLMLKAALHSWTPEQLARSIESKAIAAYAAKLAQGVELEVVGRLDVSKYRGHLENYSFDLTADDLDGSYPLVPLSTAQDAVAAERVKAARTAIEMMARDGWKCVPRIMTGDMVSVWRIRSHNGGSIESCFAAAVDASTDWADWKEIRA